jgi:acyl-CoA hydrolase
MMDPAALYKSKLTTPAAAVSRIASGANLSMGMAVTEPPALLQALADRAAARNVEGLKFYYSSPLASPVRRFCATNSATAFTLIACSSARSSAP